MSTKTKGVTGESLAADYLQRNGYKVDKRNYRSRYGEIDIIAYNSEYLLFVEVKARGKTLVAAREAVTEAKQSKIIKTALKYLEENESNLQPRFDVIEVYFEDKKQPRLCHIENAFDAEGYY